MNWQLSVVAILVGVAVLYLGLQSWRAWRGAKGKCGGCGCGGVSKSRSAASADNQLIAPESLRVKARGSSNGR